MIVPSIDLQGGSTVQLVGGKDKAIDAGDPRPLAERFGRVGEIAVIDLDRAMGRGNQEDMIRPLLALAPCRVGGGIRDVETAIGWLDAGAHRVILGTAAAPEVLRALPRDRVVVALDADSGEVVVEGWRKRTGCTIEQRLRELREYAEAFLITFVEREGRMGGVDLDRAARLVDAARGAHVTFAGGIKSPDEIAALDAMGADAQVGMAIYTGRLDLTDAFAAPLRSDRPDGLWPTVVTEADGSLLGLCYSSTRSLRAALDRGIGVYESRRRGMWVKGASSGATQELLSVAVDCDRDALCFRVRQAGNGFCHRETWSCFAQTVLSDPTPGLAPLMRRLGKRVEHAPAGSYTKRLLDDPALLAAKLREEAGELADAAGTEHVVAEAADLFYFACVALVRGGASLEQVWQQLDERARWVTRRPGHAKKAGDPSCSRA